MARRAIERGSVGETIRKARTDLKMTQAELAAKLGYSAEGLGIVVRKWESGKTLPPLDKIRILAQTLNVPIDALIP